jgi:cytochrome c peroxidase
MACADCHAEKSGFTGPNPGINLLQVVYPGAVHTRAGNRKPPTAAYGGDSPIFDYDTIDELFIGGMFWDGRATGWVTGDPLADQAMGPFLNSVEQNLSSEEEVCVIVASSKYAKLYEDVYGESIDCEATDDDGHLISYKNFALAIAAFERSVEITSYTSKFDYVMNGEADFTEQEAWGWELFQEDGKGMCALCHPAPLFTDFSYDNLGVPKNPNNPFYDSNPEGFAWVDPGLGGFLGTRDDLYFFNLGLDKGTTVAENMGKHKVPTLRNVDKRPGPGFVKAYMHNGVFKSLEAVVKFYDERDEMIDNGQIIPEVTETINTDELGDLGLSDEEEAALVAFMKTLSDGYNPKKDKYK